MGSELPGVRTSQHRSPIPTFPKGKEPHQTALNTASRDSRLLGRDGEGLRVVGEGSPTATIFVPAQAGLFLPPKAAF